MKKTIISFLALSLFSSPLLADDVKSNEIHVCYHPIPLTVGIVVGALTGGLGGLILGAVVGEGSARLVNNGSLKCESK